MKKNSILNTKPRIKSSPVNDAVISLLCSAIFAAIYAFSLIKLGLVNEIVIRMALVFFLAMASVSFIVLRLLAYLRKKRHLKNNN